MSIDAVQSRLLGSAAFKTDVRSGNDKALKAAQEFEGVLLSSLLSQLQASFRVPGAEPDDAAGESIRSIGLQELGTVWAKTGGIGLGKMVLHSIDPLARRPLLLTGEQCTKSEKDSGCHLDQHL